MAEANRSRKELIEELKSLRARVVELEQQALPSQTDRELQQRYQLLIEMSPDAVMIIQDKRHEYVNPAFTRIFGYTQDEMEEEFNFLKMVSDQEKAAVRRRYENRLSNKTISQNYRIDLIAKDGSLVPCETSAKRIEYNGRPAILVIIRDISERVKAENELQNAYLEIEQKVNQRTAQWQAAHEKLLESEQQFRILVETMNDALVVKNAQGIITYVNQKFCDLIGLNQYQILGRSPMEFIQPADIPFFQKEIESRRKQHQSQYELSLRDQNGIEIPVIVSAQAIFDHDKNFQGSFAILTDIRKLSQAKEKIILLTAIVEQSSDSIICTDTAFRINYLNQAAINMFGWELHELCGKTPDILNADPRAKEIQAEIYATISVGGQYVGEVLNRRKDGSTFYCQMKVSPLYDENQKIYGYLGIQCDITKLKVAEEASQLSEQKYRTLFEQAADSIVLFDVEQGEIAEFNDKTCTTLGYTREEFSALRVSEIEVNESAEEIHRHIAKIFAQGSDLFETRHRAKTGEILNVQVKSKVTILQGKPYIQSIWRDITEKKRADERMHRLHAAIEQSTEGIAISDLEGNLLFINRAFAYMHGYEKQELIGNNLSICHSSEQRRAVNAANEQIHRIGFFIGEIWHTRRDGSTFPGYMHNSLLKDESGTPIGMIGTLHDITESKRLTEVMNLLYAAIEQSAEGVALVNMEGNIKFLNDTFAALHGYESHELIGKNLYTFHTLEQMATVEAANETVRKTGVYDGEIWHAHRDGSTFLGHMHNSLLRDKDGNPMGILGTLTDITHLRQLEQELALLREKIMQAEQISQVSLLSATIAHEINQPLSVIRLLTQDIHDQLSTISCPAKILEDSQEVLVAVSRIVDIMQRYRNISFGQRKNRMKNINLMHIAQRLHQIFLENARRAKLDIHLDLPSDICLLEGYVGEVEQIFFILIENAIQAADGQKKHTLRIQGKVRAGTMNLVFSDDCGGIAPEIEDKIFEPFFTTKSPGEGTGLGLNILERIVRENGGSITLENRPEQGSTFVVTIPMKSPT